MAKRKKVQVLLHLTPEARRILRLSAAKKNRTLSSVVEILIMSFLSRTKEGKDADALD